MSGPVDDRELARRAQQGDLGAFEELVRMHQRPLYSYLYRMCRNTADAEELTQAAFVRAWKSIDGFRHGSTFKTWLFRIATNACINLRTRRRPTEELPETLAAPPGQEPVERHEQRRREELVRSALARLPDEQRAALVMSVYDQMSYQEIGEALGKSVRAVDSLLVRAKANLRRFIGGECGPGPG